MTQVDIPLILPRSEITRKASFYQGLTSRMPRTSLSDTWLINHTRRGLPAATARPAPMPVSSVRLDGGWKPALMIVACQKCTLLSMAYVQYRCTETTFTVCPCVQYRCTTVHPFTVQTYLIVQYRNAQPIQPCFYARFCLKTPRWLETCINKTRSDWSVMSVCVQYPISMYKVHIHCTHGCECPISNIDAQGTHSLYTCMRMSNIHMYKVHINCTNLGVSTIQYRCALWCIHCTHVCECSIFNIDVYTPNCVQRRKKQHWYLLYKSMWVSSTTSN